MVNNPLKMHILSGKRDNLEPEFFFKLKKINQELSK